LPYSHDLRLRVRDPEWNTCGANVTLARPIRNAMGADHDPADVIGRSRTPCGESIARHVDTTEQIRSFHAVKIERQRFAIVDDANRHVGLSLGEVCQFA
jgi:hypothetical protein